MPSRASSDQSNVDIPLVLLEKHTEKKQSSLLERLPAELRLEVFEHVLQDYEDSIVSPFDNLPFTYPPSAPKAGEYWTVPLPALEIALIGLQVLYQEFLALRLEMSVFVVVVRPEMEGKTYLHFDTSVSPHVKGGIKDLLFVAG